MLRVLLPPVISLFLEDPQRFHIINDIVSRLENERADESNTGASTGGTDGTGSPGSGDKDGSGVPRITQKEMLTKSGNKLTKPESEAIV
jgi:hypothetical protein